MAKQRKANRQAGKTKLSDGQKRRMQANQKRRVTAFQEGSSQPDSVEYGPAETAIVTSRYGQHADIQTAQQERLRCHIRRGVESLVCGDHVVWRRALQTSMSEQHTDFHGVIEAVVDRTSLLSRPDYYDGLKPVAANIDRIFIVSSVVPAFSSQIIDRYLVACEDIEIEPVIVLNKAELLNTLDASEQQQINTDLQMYENIGYEVLQVSAHAELGMESIKAALVDHTSIFVGQSGVGKSSLVNALFPRLELLTGAVSDNSGLGQHTTTVATWFDLAQASEQAELTGALIDSPGIREFALWHLAPERVAWCYRDFRPWLGQCKFRDCKHHDDPGCALQEAVISGELAATRLYNFHKIIASMQSQAPTRVTSKAGAKRT